MDFFLDSGQKDIPIVFNSTPFSNLLVKSGYMTSEQMKQALEAQNRQNLFQEHLLKTENNFD